MKPKWDRYQISDDGEIDVRRDVDHNGVPFLDVQAVGGQVVVQPDAGNHVRVYFRRDLDGA
jgi:hypothetical protein